MSVSFSGSLPALPRFSSPRQSARYALMRSTMLAATLASGMLASALHAQTLPSGGKVVAGTAGISNSGQTTLITQTSSKSIIDWTSFSVGKGGTVQFDNGSGATLNRVTGGNLSSIDGLLSATGSVYLINPNGVIIGKSGVVKTGGGFVASTLDIDNANFLNDGDQTLAGTSLASVVNLGQIGALGGDVALVAANVRNDGTVVAPNGTLGLLAGSRVLMRDATVNDGKFLVLSGTAGTSVSNTGALEAASVELRAEGGSIYALAGNTTGIIRATGVTATDGHIFLTAGDTGSVTVSGSTLKAADSAGNGGTISITGGHIAVASDTTLDASATSATGNGGTVSVIADLTAGSLGFQGTALARGGTGGGGQVETSGHTVDFDGATIDTSAAGQSGTWLVDPDNLTIDAASATTIDANLATTDVTLRTTSTTASGTGVSSSGNGDIIVDSALAWSSSHTLTLDAYHSIQINANVTVKDNGGVVLKTNDGSSGGDYTFALGASLTFDSTNPDTNQVNTAQSLNINSATYTLLTGMTGTSGLSSMNGSSSHYALASNPTSSSNAVDVVGTFYGTFTGLGHTINNLAITGTGTNAGLFGTLESGGTVRDIGIVGGSVSGSTGLGGLVGLNYGNIDYAYSSAAVTGSSNHDGGLVGVNYGTISNSFATGAIKGTSGVGGLVGVNEVGATISNSYANGSATGTSTNTGGLVGTNDATIQYSYATGAVTAPSGTGGLVGSQASGTITSSYYDSSTTGLSGGTGTGKTTSAFQAASLASLGFSAAVWGNGLYPYLTSFYPNGAVAVSGVANTSSNTAAVKATVNLYSGGNLLGSATSGANGYYYILLAPGMAGSTAGLTETLSGAGTVSGAAYSDGANLSNTSLGGLNVTSGAFNYATDATSYATFMSGVTSAFGSSYYGTLQTSLASAPATIKASGSFTLDTGLGMTGTVVIKTLGGDLTIGSDITVSGSNSLTLDSYGNLFIDANLTASGSNAVTLTTGDGGSGDYSFALGKSLSFTGSGGALTINGNGYTLLYSMADFAGINGSSSNYALAADLTSSGTYTEAVVDLFSGALTGLGHTISNLTVDSTSGNWVGLIAGNHGTIRDIGILGGTITGTSDAGALAGDNYGVIQNAYATSTISGGGGNAGGLVGSNTSTGTIINAYAAGYVSANGNGGWAGGLVGYNSGTITNVYATASVSAGDTGNAGGLVGFTLSGTISNAYATGTVVVGSGGGTGGLIGGTSGGTITDGYYDADTTGMPLGAQSDGSIGEHTSDLQSSALPSGFSSSAWAAGAGLYPYLKSFYPGGVVAVSGTAGTSSNTTAVNATLTLYSGGSLVGDATSGADGYYYIPVAAGTAGSTAGVTETLSGAGSASGAAYSDTNLSNTTISGLNPASGAFNYFTNSTSYTTFEAAVGTGAASAFGSGNYTSLQTSLASASNHVYAYGSFTVDENLAAGTTLIQTLGGDLTVSSDLTLSGSSALTLNAYNNLYIDADITAAGTNAVTFKTGDGGSGDYSFALGKSLSFTGSGGALTINGNAYTLLSTMDGIAGMNLAAGQYYALTTNLTPSSSYTAAVVTGNFGGTFAGLGHTITDLTITGTGSSVGLFNTTLSGATVRDIGLDGGSIHGVVAGALVGVNFGTIRNAWSSATISGTDTVGGLVGGNPGLITNSFDTGVITTVGSVAGGLAGNNSGTISNSYTMTSVEAPDYAGGLVGYMLTGGLVTTSYAAGTETATQTGGVASLNTGATVTNSYYDTTMRGSAANYPMGTGETTSALQGTLPSGFSSSIWGTASGLYPYLKSFFPNGIVAISGTADTGSNTAAAGAAVSLYSGGSLLGRTTSGVNGYYYIPVAAGTSGTAAGATESLSGASSTSGAVYSDALNLSSNITGLNIISGAFSFTTADTSYSALKADAATTFGSAYSTIQTSTATANTYITASNAFDFGQAYSFGGGLSITATGGITLTGNLTTAGATGFNSAVTLAADSTINAGSGAVTFASTIDGGKTLTLSGASLTFDGAIGGTTHLTSLSGTATGGDIDVDGQITTTGGIFFAANGNFVNTAGASALNAGTHFTVYTQTASDPTGTMPTGTFDGLTATNYYNDAYNFTDGSFASTVPTGNHFVYGYAATLTPTLSGSASKVYDGTTTAGTSGLTLGYGSLQSAGDSISIAFTGAAFDTKNAGSGKTVTANGITFTSNPNNYILASTTASAAVGSISKATLTLNAVTDSRGYDGDTDSSGTVTYTGLQTGDTLTGLIQSYGSRNVMGTNGSTLAVTGYNLSDGNSGGNYTVVTNTAAGTISKATLTLYAGTDSRTYDGGTDSSGTVTYGGLQTGDTLTGLTQTFDSKNVLGTNGSTLAVTGYNLSDGNSGGNYTVVTDTATGTIGKATLTLYAGTDSRTYDGGTDSSGTVTYGGLQTGDTLTGLTQAFDSKNVLGTNGSTLSVTGYNLSDGNNGGNYTVVTDTAAGTISKATLTLNAATDSRGYDGHTDSSGTVTYTGLQTGDSLTGLVQSYDSRNVMGTNGSTLSVTGYTLSDGDSGGNYTIATNTAAGTISKAALTLAATTDTKTYDATTTSNATVIVEDLQGGDTVSNATQSFGSKNVMATAGSILVVNGGYTVNDGNGGNNYTVSFEEASGTINPAALTLAAVTGTKTYDATTTSTGTVDVTGLQGADTVTGDTQSFTSKNVLGAGGSTLAVNSGYVLNDGNGGGNYTVTTQTASGTINPAALTLAAVTGTKTYDATTASTATVDVTGLQGSDTVTGDTQSFTSKNVLGAGGSILAVNGGYVVNDGNGGGNYTITTQTASGTINPATLTLAAVTGTKTYDATTASDGTVGVSGLQGSDTVTGDTQSFTSKNVLGTGGSTLSVNGGYTVNDGNGGGNYAITTQTAAGSITPAALTASLTGTTSKTYDSTVSATLTVGNYVLTGILGTDAVALNDPTSGAYADANAGTAKTVTVTGLALTGTASGNYTVSGAASANIGVITPAMLTITADTLGKNAGASDPLLTYALTSGTLFGKDTLNGNLSRATGEDPGAYGITQGTLAASSNYDVTFIPGVFTITQVALQNAPVVNPVSTTAIGQPVIQPTPVGPNTSSSPTSSDASSTTTSDTDSGAKDAGSNAGSGDEKAAGPNVQTAGQNNSTCSGDGCANTPYPTNQFISSSISFSQ